MKFKSTRNNSWQRKDIKVQKPLM